MSLNIADPAWAWAPYEPTPERQWNLKWAGHLYRRAAFGGNWDALRQAVQDGPQTTIDRFLHPDGRAREFNLAQDDYETAAGKSGSIESLRAWWLRRMCETPVPLLERMTLFWHSQFAISSEAVSNPALMCRYLQCLRQNALGDFGALLEAVMSQPAVFIGLNSRPPSVRRSGGENLARALLEHFTIGPANFTETDLQAVTRGLSGWFVSGNELRYSEREHVSKESTLFGQTGDFTKQEMLGILSRQRSTAQFVVRRLYRFLISETGDLSEALVAPLVDAFARTRDIAALVGTMLRSNLFFSPAAYRQKIKSPVEFALGMIRPLNGGVGTMQLGADLAGLGQDLLNPPTVAGWAGYTCWINRFTVIARARLAEALLSASGTYGGKLDPSRGYSDAGSQGKAVASEWLLDLFLQSDVAAEVRVAIAESNKTFAGSAQKTEALRRAAIEIACLPEFHLA